MTNTVLIKRSGTANAIPLAANVALGELAINYADGNLFYKNSSNVVTLLTSNQFVSVAGNVTGGNITTPGLISATGNIITGSNIVTGGGSGGNLTGANVISATTLSASSNVTGGNLNAVGLSLSGNVVSALVSAANITTTANISGNYFIGNGSLLTGIAGGGGGSSISNGTSNVTVLSSANITVGVAGTSNVIVWATTGQYVAGVVSATGNVTGNYFIGNGSQLTGITASAGAAITNGTSNVTVSSSSNITANVAGSAIATWATTGEYITGLISATGNITGNNIISGGGSGGNITGANVISATTLSATANITGGNLNAAGLSLSSNVVSALNVTGNIAGGNITTPGLISATGNITGANVISATTLSATGNITGGNLITAAAVSAASVSASGNITSGNLNAAGLSLSSNVVSALNLSSSLTAATTVSAVGNITGGNLITAAAVSAVSVSASGNITGGNVNTNTLSGTGTTIKSTGALNLEPTGNVVVNSKYINGVTNPVQNQDVATKIYVDNAVSTAISYHEAVAAATTTTLAATTGGTISYTQPNGAGNGVGALLTTTGVFNLIDTANVQTVGTRILVKNEANAVLNGVYTWANATNIVRSTDADTYGPANPNTFSINDYFFVSNGNVNAGSAWIVDSPSGTITFGTSNIAFAQFSSSQTYTANTAAGISLAGTVINAKVDGTTTAFDGGGNISVKASANLTTPNIGAATGSSLSVTANISGNYFIGNGSLLTGIAGGGGGASIANGTSNVNINTSDGNISFSVNGTANVVVVDNLGLNFLDTTTQDTGMNLGRVTTTAQWWNLP